MKEDINHLTKIDHFARWSFLLYINCINSYNILNKKVKEISENHGLKEH